MKTNTIITIGRQYGSAGRQIGRVLAEELGIKCYDKELLERAAKESGLCEELFENHDEKPTNSFLYSLVMDTYSLVILHLHSLICQLIRKFSWLSLKLSRKSQLRDLVS